jgi:hypothetical protein
LRHATRPIRERRRANVSVTLFGVLAVSFMMVMYALEPRGALSSVYGFAANTWPFGAVEAIWTVVALRRWQRCA